MPRVSRSGIKGRLSAETGLSRTTRDVPVSALHMARILLTEGVNVSASALLWLTSCHFFHSPSSDHYSTGYFLSAYSSVLP